MKKYSRRVLTGVWIFAYFAGTAALGSSSEEPIVMFDFSSYTEAPIFDYQGNLFVSEATGRVMRITPAGEKSLWTEQRKANGHKVLPDGKHLLCVEGGIMLLDGAGNILRPFTIACDGVPLRAPNDLTLDGKGGCYFTDPGGSRERPIGTVHYVDPAGVNHLVAGGMSVPNGLVMSPDGAFLYVAETVPNRILRFSVRPDGRLGPLTIFAELPEVGPQGGPDGITIDRAGNVYVAHLGLTAIQVLDASGHLVRTLPGGNFDASNLVFGGPALDQLYITGSIGFRGNTPGRVYRITLSKTTGVSPLLPQAR